MALGVMALIALIYVPALPITGLETTLVAPPPPPPAPVAAETERVVPRYFDARRLVVYRPAYLNGRTVQVATEIDVHFHLAT